jgi:hypothetical protein
MATAEKTKKLPFFKFDVNAWMLGKVQFLTLEERGIFIELCVRIWMEKGSVKNDEFLHRFLKIEMPLLAKALKTFLTLGILIENDGFLSVKFINEQLCESIQYSDKMREVANQKWKKKMPSHAKDKENGDIKEKDKKETSGKPEGEKPLTTSNEMIQAAERISSKHPRLTKPQRTQFEIVAAINRAIEKDIPVDKAIEFLEAQTERYAEAVSKWPKEDRQYILNSENWFKDGCYSEDPELWKRDGDKSDDDDNDFVH